MAITSSKSHQIILIYLSQLTMLNHQSLFLSSFLRNVHRIFWMNSWMITSKWHVPCRWWTRDWFFLILSFQTKRELTRLQLDKVDQTTISSNKNKNNRMSNQPKIWTMNNNNSNNNTKIKSNKTMQTMKEENKRFKMLAKKKTTINNNKWKSSSKMNKCELILESNQ